MDGAAFEFDLNAQKWVQEKLFPLMFNDSNEDIRAHAIHIAHTLGFVESLIEGAFDRRANVRFHANHGIGLAWHGPMWLEMNLY